MCLSGEGNHGSFRPQPPAAIKFHLLSGRTNIPCHLDLFLSYIPSISFGIMSDNYPIDIWCQNDIASTSRQLHRVASTLTRRHLYVMCPLGSSINRSNRMLPKKFKSQSTVTYMRLFIMDFANTELAYKRTLHILRLVE